MMTTSTSGSCCLSWASTSMPNVSGRSRSSVATSTARVRRSSIAARPLLATSTSNSDLKMTRIEARTASSSSMIRSTGFGGGGTGPVARSVAAGRASEVLEGSRAIRIRQFVASSLSHNRSLSMTLERNSRESFSAASGRGVSGRWMSSASPVPGRLSTSMRPP